MNKSQQLLSNLKMLEGRKKKEIDPYPNDVSHKLDDGDDDTRPKPKNGVRYTEVGEPKERNFKDLDFDTGSISIAKSRYHWNPSFRHENTKPVAVIKRNGKHFVLDGYHRIVQRAKDGYTTVMTQEKE